MSTRFITDFLEQMVATGADGTDIVIPRYGVWEQRSITHYDGVPFRTNRPQVIATGHSIKELFRDYGSMPVHRIDEIGRRDK